jgi:hypothetical protein
MTFEKIINMACYTLAAVILAVVVWETWRIK